MAFEDRTRGGDPIAEEPEAEQVEESKEKFNHSRDSSMEFVMRRKSLQDQHRRTDSSHSTHSTHRQMSSSSSIESADSSRSYASSTTTVGSKSNTQTPAPHRKRLSLNFASLPVVGSPYTSPSSNTQNNSGGDHVYSHSPSRSVTLSRRKTIASEPVSYGHHHYNSISESPSTRARAGSQSVSGTTGQSSSGNGTESTNSLDRYLAKLAAKERKVVELKDEFKRVQLALKQAEDDLRQFRRQASTAIARPSLDFETKPVTAPSANSVHSTPTATTTPSINSASSINSTPSTARKPHDTNTSIAMNTTTRAPRKKLSLDSYEPPKIEKPAPTKHVALRSTSPTHHHNHHHMTASTYGLAPVATTGALLPPRDDVLNMGRRVVEELGTQFWGLFEDIKNVTIGDEQFTPPAANNTNTPLPGPQRSTSLRRRRSTRSESTTANSYYML